MHEDNFKKIYGWDNHETYSLKLYLDNDLYHLSEGYKRNSKTWVEFSDKIKDHFHNLRDVVLRNPNQDALRLLLSIGSLERVNWDQIAQSIYGED